MAIHRESIRGKVSGVFPMDGYLKPYKGKLWEGNPIQAY